MALPPPAKRPSAAGSPVADERSPGVGQPIDLGASGVHKRLAAFSRHHRLEGERLLDLGCGNGAYTQVLANGYRRVVAVDPTAEHLQLFRQTLSADRAGRVHLVRMVGEHLGFPDASFDAVTCIEVLEHVHSVEKTLAEVHRVLRPGGAFLITVPNRAFPFETHMVTVRGRTFPGRRLPGLPYLPGLHARVADARIFTARSLRRLMLAADFEEVASDYVMPPFDRWSAGRKYVKPIVDVLERTPARAMGVSVVGVYRKPSLTRD